MSTARMDLPGPPPYVRPSMADVRAVPKSGLVAVSTFSGCGGSSLGLRLAGFEVRCASEFVPAAADTYMANFPGTPVSRDDIRDLKAEEILDWCELEPGQLDLLEGSPPCASFSAAGNREKNWGDVKKYSDTRQRTDDLFGEYVRLLRELRPRAFIAENVPGMMTGRALENYCHKVWECLSLLTDLPREPPPPEEEPHRSQLGMDPDLLGLGDKDDLRLNPEREPYVFSEGELRQLRDPDDPGYFVWISKPPLNAVHYGVPQDRRRLLFVGFRADLGIDPKAFFPPVPTTDEPFTTGQALESVDPQDPDHAPYLEASSMRPFAVGRTWDALVLRDAKRGSHGDRNAIPPLEDYCAREECGLHLEEHKVTRRDNKNRVVEAICADGEKALLTKDYFMFQLPKLDKPCPTLTATGAQAGAASVVHPEECRKLTPAEAKAVCGFPADFILTGTREQRYERMGRAVPPPMMAAVGRTVRDVLLRCAE